MANAVLNAVERAKTISKGNGQVYQGAEVIDFVAERGSAQLRTNVTISDGDVFTIPPFPDKSTERETDKQWLGKKLGRDTAEREAPVIVSVFCEVTNQKRGSKLVKELFVTQITKAVYDVKKEEWMPNKGDAVDAVVSAVGSQVDSWKAICGKKIQFSNPVKVDAIRQDYNGNRPDRAYKDTVWTVNFVK